MYNVLSFHPPPLIPCPDHYIYSTGRLLQSLLNPPLPLLLVLSSLLFTPTRRPGPPVLSRTKGGCDIRDYCIDY